MRGTGAICFRAKDFRCGRQTLPVPLNALHKYSPRSSLICDDMRKMLRNFYGRKNSAAFHFGIFEERSLSRRGKRNGTVLKRVTEIFRNFRNNISLRLHLTLTREICLEKRHVLKTLSEGHVLKNVKYDKNLEKSENARQTAFPLTVSKQFYAMNNKNRKRGIAAVLSFFLVAVLGLTGALNSEYAAFCQNTYSVNRAVMSQGDTAYCSKGTDADGQVMLIPGGMAFGVRMNTKGVLVVGFSRTGTEEKKSPAELAGIKTKDVIIEVDGKSTDSSEELIKAVSETKGAECVFTVLRGDERKNFTVRPEKDVQSGEYKAGIWVKDSSAGIGTVTVINPANNRFSGLGHGICDSDTGALMPFGSGNVYDVSVVAVRKGKAGAPGEIKGFFDSAICGTVSDNTATGVCGRLIKYDTAELSRPLPLAERSEVKEGAAYIRCTLSDDRIGEYEIQIKKITDYDGESKNFVIEVTDERLLAQTGGIVQGMSGSPIIQNGKIVGAVTHVMVNEPRTGYGIFIDNMPDIVN